MTATLPRRVSCGMQASTLSMALTIFYGLLTFLTAGVVAIIVSATIKASTIRAMRESMESMSSAMEKLRNEHRLLVAENHFTSIRLRRIEFEKEKTGRLLRHALEEQQRLEELLVIAIGSLQSHQHLDTTETLTLELSKLKQRREQHASELEVWERVQVATIEKMDETTEEHMRAIQSLFGK